MIILMIQVSQSGTASFPGWNFCSYYLFGEKWKGGFQDEEIFYFFAELKEKQTLFGNLETMRRLSKNFIWARKHVEESWKSIPWL